MSKFIQQCLCQKLTLIFDPLITVQAKESLHVFMTWHGISHNFSPPNPKYVHILHTFIFFCFFKKSVLFLNSKSSMKIITIWSSSESGWLLLFLVLSFSMHCFSLWWVPMCHPILTQLEGICKKRFFAVADGCFLLLLQHAFGLGCLDQP